MEVAPPKFPKSRTQARAVDRQVVGKVLASLGANGGVLLAIWEQGTLCLVVDVEVKQNVPQRKDRTHHWRSGNWGSPFGVGVKVHQKETNYLRRGPQF